MKTSTKITIIVILFIMSLSLSVFSSEKEDTSDARLKAAKRYLKAVPMSKMIDDSIKELAKRVPPEKRAEFVNNMKEVLRTDFLEKVTLESMIRIFTTEEMNALADFYGSDVGKSVMSKFGVYMGEVMPVLQQEIERAIKKLQKEGKR